jgi:hypothetical protein
MKSLSFLFANSVEITKITAMEVAEISGLVTYHKGMRNLVEFGYIQYEPSYNPTITSQVCLLKDAKT